MLKIEGIYKEFLQRDESRLPVLEGISLEVKEGEIVSLVGPSGCGKSTLLDIIAGLTIPDRGKVWIGEEEVTGKKGKVSYMPQNDLLFPWRTILDNVILPLQLAGVSTNKAREEGRRFLPLFGLEGFAESYPSMLSGGMRQRAALLRTYLIQKDPILLDEPFGRLDALTRAEMQKWLLTIWEKMRRTILLVTHDVEEAIFLSDRIYLLSSRPGRVIKEVFVPLPRPRTEGMKTEEDLIEIKRILLEALENKG